MLPSTCPAPAGYSVKTVILQQQQRQRRITYDVVSTVGAGVVLQQPRVHALPVKAVSTGDDPQLLGGREDTQPEGRALAEGGAVFSPARASSRGAWSGPRSPVHCGSAQRLPLPISSYKWALFPGVRAHTRVLGRKTRTISQLQPRCLVLREEASSFLVRRALTPTPHTWDRQSCMLVQMVSLGVWKDGYIHPKTFCTSGMVAGSRYPKCGG